MDTLTRALREAADDAPTSLGRSVDAGTTWHRGRRRLALARAGNGVGLLAVLVVVLGLVLAPFGVPRAAVPAGQARDGVASHPQRIGHQWWVRDLPTSGTPVAGVLGVVDGDDFSWQAITPDGTRYDLPDGDGSAWPAVSDDGTRVGYLAATPDGSYRVLDLVSGARTDFPEVGTANLGRDGRFLGGRTYAASDQTPSFFSPGKRRLAISGQRATGWGGPLVLDADGGVTEVQGMDQPAGWLDDDRLLGREFSSAGASPESDEIRLVVWDRRTGTTSPLGTLAVTAPGRGPFVPNAQFWGRVRGNGTLWLLVTEREGGIEERMATTGVRLPDLRPVDLRGRPVAGPLLTDLEDAPDRGLDWSRGVPLARGEGALLARADGDGGPLVVLEPGVDVAFQVWAQDALDGAPSWTPFGTSTPWLAWWWQEVALAGVAVLGAWWLRRRWVRRPRRPAAERSVVGGRVAP